MLVPDADVDALAAALVELLTDIELRARLTAEAVAASPRGAARPRDGRAGQAVSGRARSAVASQPEL